MELMSTLMILYKRRFVMRKLYGEEYGPIKYLDSRVLEMLCKREYAVVRKKGIIITEKGRKRILRIPFEELAWIVVQDIFTFSITPTPREIKYILEPKMTRMGIARLSKYLTSEVGWIRELAKKVVDENGNNG